MGEGGVFDGYSVRERRGVFLTVFPYGRGRGVVFSYIL